MHLHNHISLSLVPRRARVSPQVRNGESDDHLESGSAVSLLLPNVHDCAILPLGEDYAEAVHEVSDSRLVILVLSL
jgi:hypothetical protein